MYVLLQNNVVVACSTNLDRLKDYVSFICQGFVRWETDVSGYSTPPCDVDHFTIKTGIYIDGDGSVHFISE